MNKAELAERLATELDISKKLAEDAIHALERIITDTLVRGERVSIAGFGIFSARNRAGRMGVNPQNPKEQIHIPAVTVPKFKAGKSLKDALKKTTPT